MWPDDPNAKSKAETEEEIKAFASIHTRKQTVKYMNREYGYSIPFAAHYLNKKGL